MRTRARFLFLVSLVAVAACGGFLSASDDEEQTASPSPDATASTADASTATGVVDAPAQAAPLCTGAKPRFVSAKEDTCALECAGSITYGAQGFCHVGYQGLALMYLKFELPQDIAAALRAGRVASASLALLEDESFGVNNDGALGAHVLRNDWVAGTSTGTYDGADLCRRTQTSNGFGWGASATASPSTLIAANIDFGASLGTQKFVASDTQVVIALDVARLVADWETRASGGADLSLLVQETETGSFVAASMNHASLTRPTVIFDVCP